MDMELGCETSYHLQACSSQIPVQKDLAFLQCDGGEATISGSVLSFDLE